MVAQKITIEPVTRIEGHAKVTINMNANGTVDHAYLHINEFRGFEKFCEGRMVFEMPLITPRICGICPVSHHLASAKAADLVLGCPPPRPANLLRELMHMGQIIQSHGMHFFELAGPDLLLGFDADPAIRNVVGLIQANPGLTPKAVNLARRSSKPWAAAASIPTSLSPAGSTRPCSRQTATRSWRPTMMRSPR